MLSTPPIENPPREHRLDLVFRALGDPTRRQLLVRLADGPAMVSELAQPFDMSLAAVGKHLRVLENAGLVDRSIEGRVHRCSLNALPLRDAGRWLAFYQRFWDETLDALIDYVEDESNR